MNTTSSASSIVQKLWNYCNVLRDDGECRLSVADEIERELDEALLRAARLRQSVLKQAFAGELVGREGAEVVERIKKLKNAGKQIKIKNI